MGFAINLFANDDLNPPKSIYDEISKEKSEKKSEENQEESNNEPVTNGPVEELAVTEKLGGKDDTNDEEESLQSEQVINNSTEFETASKYISKYGISDEKAKKEIKDYLENPTEPMNFQMGESRRVAILENWDLIGFKVDFKTLRASFGNLTRDKIDKLKWPWQNDNISYIDMRTRLRETKEKFLEFLEGDVGKLIDTQFAKYGQEYGLEEKDINLVKGIVLFEYFVINDWIAFDNFVADNFCNDKRAISMPPANVEIKLWQPLLPGKKLCDPANNIEGAIKLIGFLKKHIINAELPEEERTEENIMYISGLNEMIASSYQVLGQEVITWYGYSVGMIISMITEDDMPLMV